MVGPGVEQMPGNTVEVDEPHVLLFPYPAQGHMPPMLKLAELLSLAGLRVTFLNTENYHHRMLRHSFALARLSLRPGFRFQTIPDGLPKDHPRPFLQFLELEESIRTRSREPYRQLLAPDGGRDPDGWSPVTCVVADGAMPLALEVAEEVGIPVIVFRTSGASAVWAYHCLPELIKGGEIPIPFPEDADLDEAVKVVPGMESFLRRRDLPSFCRQIGTTADPRLQFVIAMSTTVTRGRALILNTFEHLEGPVLSHIRSRLRPITFAVGPLHHALFKTPTNEQGGAVAAPPKASGSASLWEEDRTCIEWLDAQQHRSVVYVSFGSVTVVTRENLHEFWHGLVDSGHRFLWVVRTDLIGGEAGARGTVPAEMEAATRERGCVVDWAPQEEVLAHPAVGCFLTHSGWNSTLESITAGVPMICWPFFADQQINSRFVSEVWRVGLDMKDLCGRSVVEKMVREAMEGESADALRRSTGEMAEMARRSTEEGGTSYMQLHGLVQYIKSISLEAL